eukprot:3865507-Pyramimonas_sp.AAC.1
MGIYHRSGILQRELARGSRLHYKTLSWQGIFPDRSKPWTWAPGVFATGQGSHEDQENSGDPKPAS